MLLGVPLVCVCWDPSALYLNLGLRHSTQVYTRLESAPCVGSFPGGDGNQVSYDSLHHA
jgi:hypothetical protein